MHDRRRFVAASLAFGAFPWVAGCERRRDVAARDASAVTWSGGWLNDATRGHRLRDAASTGAVDGVTANAERHAVVIVGGGIAGLTAARALLRAGIDDIVVIELEDEAGGNARGHRIAGIDCPLGAHYLPVPGDDLPALREWLAEIGLMQHAHGRWRAAERHLCHAPQERLWIDGVWQEGLLPAAEARSARVQQYRSFAALVGNALLESRFVLPMAGGAWTNAHAALDAQTFAAWLARHGLDDAALLGYLDYACRDDYGAGIATVSAWAGLHYFASRHGFRAPGNDGDGGGPVDDERHGGDEGGVFTWPEGNAFLSRRLAAPLGSRLRRGHVVTRIATQRHEVIVDAWDTAHETPRRLVAQRVIAALPLHVAARVIDEPALAPDLRHAAALVPHAPWLVANLRIRSALDDRAGAAPAWDNVLFAPAGASDALGYVDASHQSLSPYRDATVITAYWALGRDGADTMRAQRRALLDEPWAVWSRRVVADLSRAHPDLPGKLDRVDLMRYGHAMALPAPGVRSALEAWGLHRPRADARVVLAHADLAGYSVFEEAFAFGDDAGRQVARELLARSGT
jgi:predicted NAD/FAD-dependent oxidoreductase